MDYHLRPLGKTCAATGEPLKPGSRCRSALVERDGQFTRLDFQEQAWTEPPEGTIGHWRAIVPAENAQKAKPLDADALLRSFELMSEEASPSNEKFRYVLSLLLLQRRKLQLTGSRNEGDGVILELTGSRGEGPWEVLDQKISGAELNELQDALTSQLASESADVELEEH